MSCEDEKKIKTRSTHQLTRNNSCVFFFFFRYKFLDDGKLGEENPFKIHPETGLISTKSPLDREKKNFYDLIIVAEDRGEVPQQATRRLQVSRFVILSDEHSKKSNRRLSLPLIFQIEILDVDDHKPYFKRSIDESPIAMKITEESPVGSEVGFIQAYDEDIGENALIDYVISREKISICYRIVNNRLSLY